MEDASAYAGSVRPLAGSTAALALSLDTGGKTLVRTANNRGAFDYSASPIYLDTLVTFTPSADHPAISDPTVKAAVFMDTNLHLWVCHGVGGAGQNRSNSDTGLVLNTNDWHRLTIKLGKLSGSADYAFTNDLRTASADGATFNINSDAALGHTNNSLFATYSTTLQTAGGTSFTLAPSRTFTSSAGKTISLYVLQFTFYPS